MLQRSLKIVSLSAVALALALGGSLGWHFAASQAQGQSYELGGWQWSENFDWISLNSGNAELSGEASVPYKVIATDGELSGWGWSSHAGWVCFGKTCDPSRICDQAPVGSCNPFSYGEALPAGGWSAGIDFANRRISGWGKIVSLKDNGWIHFGPGTADVAQNQKGEQCYDCKSTTSTPPEITSCNTCFTRTKFDGVNIPDASVDSVSGGSGNICFGCTACSKIESAGSGSRVACGACASCHLYGGASDSQTGASLGWSWNGNDNGAGLMSKDGAGWIQSGSGSGLVYPWLQTQYGSVFGSNAASSFRQRSEVSGSNATYCIFAQDVDNFSSQNCQQNISGVSIGYPFSPTYKNALGRLDLVGLSTPAISGRKYNKYGNIIAVENGLTTWDYSKVLDGKVYVINGDLRLADGFRIMNGGNDSVGNGLVIVNGDLEIRQDFSYDAGEAAGDLKRLASVAWVVKGDINVLPNVKQAVGAFIALGEDGVGCLYDNGAPCDGQVAYPKYRPNGYGVFSTGASGEPLTISGLLMAKAFNFQRSYSDIGQGSEKVVYDGRLIANPPPGLKSLLEALPIIRDFEF